MTLATLPELDRKTWEASDFNFLLFAGLVWKNVVEAHEEARHLVDPGHWLDVRYEDVLTDPRRELGRMLELSGLPWDARFEQQFARQQLSPTRAEAFRSDLSSLDVAMLDEALGDTLRRYGYRTNDLGASDAGSD
jgi:omega-hydroxy-beta-dihydromenaquinone-9 sulfotransferase